MIQWQDTVTVQAGKSVRARNAIQQKNPKQATDGVTAVSGASCRLGATLPDDPTWLYQEKRRNRPLFFLLRWNRYVI
jgi:hypothetical protein